MSVVVAYKYAANPQDASVGIDGGVDWSRAKPSVSDYDAVAIQVGRDAADAAATELIGVSVGTSAVASSMAKKNALSKGLDRAILTTADDADSWSATKVASAIAGLVRSVGDADLVLTGDASIDDGSKMVSGLVAAALVWPCFQEVISVAKSSGGYEIRQAIAGGVRTISVEGPVVLAVSSDAATPKVPSMKDILAAGKKPAALTPAADLDLVEAPLTVTGHTKPASRARKNHILSGDDTPSQLIAALRADGVI